MNELITINPKEKQKGFLSENLVLNKIPIDHEIVFNKIKSIKLFHSNEIVEKYILAYDEYFQKKRIFFPKFNSNLEDANMILKKLMCKN